VEGSERLKPEDFDTQVKDCQAELAQRQKELSLGDKKVAARASPYVE